METYIGCSGYYYNHWIGRFYPDDLPKNKWLPFYAEHFNTVEINNTFYRMPDEKAVKNWVAITPKDFVFAVKGYRYMTHMKKLVIDDSSLDYLSKFQKIVSLFGEKMGPLLWQMPRSFELNIPRLEKFCSVVSHDFNHVFEFRNAGWYTEEVFEVLAKYNHAFCMVSSPGQEPWAARVTSGLAYIRFHGKGSWYNDNYSNEDLMSWKEKLQKIGAKRLFAYFNNDANAYAVNNGKYFASLFRREKAIEKAGD